MRRLLNALRTRGFAVFTAVILSSPAFAQSTGTISGRITDQSGLAMPGVSIVATNTATGIARDTVTNEQGLYSMAALQPGTYDVKVELAGFAMMVNRADENYDEVGGCGAVKAEDVASIFRPIFQDPRCGRCSGF